MTEEIITKLIIAFILFVSATLLTILKIAYRIYSDVKKLKQRSDNARGENILQFRLLKALTKVIKSLIHAIRTGDKNGSLSAAEKEVDETEKKIDCYLSDSIH